MIDIAQTLMQALPEPEIKTTAIQVVNLLTDHMKQSLLDGHRIEISGFGTFEPPPRKNGLGRTPRPVPLRTSPRGRASASSPVRG